MSEQRNLSVMCARSMTSVVRALAERFTVETGRAVDIAFGTVGALQGKLDAGETADVLILGSAMLAKMERTGAVVAGSRKELAQTSIGTAVREGAPAPDMSTPEAFKQALIGARAIAFSDPAVGGSAGVHLANLWDRMGIAGEIARKAMPQKNGSEVAARVAEGSADLGLTLIAEIVPVAGVRVIGKLPAPLGNDTIYAAGVSASCGERKLAAAFIAALSRPTEREVWTAAGFEWLR